MASLGLKLFYLRTREKKLSQSAVAKELGIRQGTVSYLEQEVTAPHWALILDLCRFYDVTPTYLADDERGVVPLPTERWGLRNALVTLGMWVEVPAGSVRKLGEGRLLCQLPPGGEFYDDEAATVRQRFKRERGSRAALGGLREEHVARERELEEELLRERSDHPRRRGGGS